MRYQNDESRNHQRGGKFTLFLATIAVSVCCGLALCAKDVQAQTADPALPPALSAWSAKPVALFGTFGLATPNGLYGVSLDVSPVRWLSLELGAGLNHAEDAQVSFMPRFRLGNRSNDAFTLGAGISHGKHSQLICFNGLLSEDDCDFGPTTWVNADIGFEVRSNGGTALRLFLGIGTAVSSNEARGNVYPYLGLAFGHAIKL
jgi:hypothetical protein